MRETASSRLEAAKKGETFPWTHSPSYFFIKYNIKPTTTFFRVSLTLYYIQSNESQVRDTQKPGGPFFLPTGVYMYVYMYGHSLIEYVRGAEGDKEEV